MCLFKLSLMTTIIPNSNINHEQKKTIALLLTIQRQNRRENFDKVKITTKNPFTKINYPGYMPCLMALIFLNYEQKSIRWQM